MFHLNIEKETEEALLKGKHKQILLIEVEQNKADNPKKKKILHKLISIFH